MSGRSRIRVISESPSQQDERNEEDSEDENENLKTLKSTWRQKSDKSEEDELLKKFFDGIKRSKTFGINTPVRLKSGNTLLHEIVIAGKLNTLEKLLAEKPDINCRNSEGDTPIMSLLKKCIHCPPGAQNENISKQQANDGESAKAPETPARNITCKKHFSCLETLLKNKPKPNIDVENKQKLTAVSYATMCYDERREEYLKKLLSINDEENVSLTLYQELDAKADSNFSQELKRLYEDNVVDFEKLPKFMYGNLSLLQAVCKYGMSKSAKYLIDLGADIGFSLPGKHRAFKLACIYAHPNILKVLLNENAHKRDYNKDGELILNKKGQNSIHLTLKYIPNSKNGYSCLEILFDAKYGLKEHINDVDEFGKTPLHYAVIRNNDDCIVKLLEHEAIIDIKDNWNQTPLMHISESALTKYLDNMISDNGIILENSENGQHAGEKEKKEKEKKPDKKAGEKDRKGSNTSNNKNGAKKLVFDFEKLFRNVSNENQKEEAAKKQTMSDKIDCLKNLGYFRRRSIDKAEQRLLHNENKEEYCFPTELLHEIKNIKRLRNVIQHPVFSMIIYFKWFSVRVFFYVYFVLYLIFSIFFTLYIYFREEKPEPKFSSKYLLLRTLGYKQKSLSYLVGLRLMTQSTDFKLYLLIPLCILIGMSLIFEAIKLWHQSYRYLKDIDNDLRLVNLFLAMIVIGCLNGSGIPNCVPLKAISILTLYFELFLVVGKHPLISFYARIFRSASLHLLKFLIIHFVLLIGFALSFHILFRSADSANVFTNPLNAFFKTIVMLTSEFDASDIPFTEYQGWSHIIFIVYIFIVTIVLFNLMIGIAFQYVNEMEENPFLHQSLAQVLPLKKTKIESSDNANGEYKVTITVTGNETQLDSRLIFNTYPYERVTITKISKEKNRWLIDFVIRIISRFSNHINDKVIDKAQKIVSKFGKNKESKQLDEIKLELNELKKKCDENQKDLVDMMKKLSDDLGSSVRITRMQHVTSQFQSKHIYNKTTTTKRTYKETEV